MKRLIIDVDTGVDDSMALLMALHAHRQGQVSIEAITLVNGNTQLCNVIKNTHRVLETVNMTEVR